MEDSTSPAENSAAAAALLLSRIPSVQALLENERVKELCRHFRREEVVTALRRQTDLLRRHIMSGKSTRPDFASGALFDAVEQDLEQQRAPSLVPVINATGVALHTNLGRAPLAATAVAALARTASGYCNLELDLEQGERGSRDAHVEQLLCRLTGAEAALVVNNGAAAILLCLSAAAKQGEVVASRGELVEIGGGFRLPEVIAQSGARLIEVGTTNRTRRADYEQAIGEHTRVILKSHPSNYRIIGYSATPDRKELAQLARQHDLAFIEDLGSGTLVDLRRYGLPHEPTVQECVRAGADAITFSGDKLLGGPQAGIIVGRSSLLAALRKHPLLRALRIDKLSLAALEATLRLYDLPVPPERHLPLLQMLALKQSVIARRARRLARELERLPGLRCALQEDVSLAGGGALPETGLPTWVVRVQAETCSAAQLARRLRLQQPALVARVSDDAVLLDLRTVAPQELRRIAALFAAAIA